MSPPVWITTTMMLMVMLMMITMSLLHSPCLWILRREGEEHESAPSFQQDLSSGIFPPRSFSTLSLSPYFFRNISFFHKEFLPAGYFSPRNFFFLLPKSSPSGFFLQWSVASRKCHWTSLALWLFAAMAENISLLITKKGKMTALQFGRAVNCKQFQFWCSRLAGRRELV